MAVFDLLAAVYKSLREIDTIDRKIWIPLSDCFYIAAHIKEKFGIEMSVYAVEKLLYEEGLLPASSYKIPKWYAQKHFPRPIKKNLSRAK